MALALRDNPDGVHDTRDIAEQRQQDVEPELGTNTDLQEYAKRWKQDRQQYSNEIHVVLKCVAKTAYSMQVPCHGKEN